MCITWARTYTLCGCTHGLATTRCPPEVKHQCEGLRLMFLETNKVTCKSCWIDGDKRTLIHHTNKDYHYHSTSSNTSLCSTFTSSHSTTEGDQSEEVWYDCLEYTYLSADDNFDTTEVSVDGLEYNSISEPSDEENNMSTREYSSSQSDESTNLDSRPSTPEFDFNYPGWLELVDGIDASRVCRAVERVYPHYRARPGPQEGNLVNVSLGEYVLFGFVNNDVELGD